LLLGLVIWHFVTFST